MLFIEFLLVGQEDQLLVELDVFSLELRQSNLEVRSPSYLLLVVLERFVDGALHELFSAICNFDFFAFEDRPEVSFGLLLDEPWSQRSYSVYLLLASM